MDRSCQEELNGGRISPNGPPGPELSFEDDVEDAGVLVQVGVRELRPNFLSSTGQTTPN